MTKPELSLEQTKQFHRAPIGFGPAPGPRQDRLGQRFDWRRAECTTVGPSSLSLGSQPSDL